MQHNHDGNLDDDVAATPLGYDNSYRIVVLANGVKRKPRPRVSPTPRSPLV
jgi:hypothetical protein